MRAKGFTDSLSSGCVRSLEIIPRAVHYSPVFGLGRNSAGCPLTAHQEALVEGKTTEGSLRALSEDFEVFWQGKSFQQANEEGGPGSLFPKALR